MFDIKQVWDKLIDNKFLQYDDKALLDAKHFNKCAKFTYKTQTKEVVGKIYVLNTLTNDDFKEINEAIYNIDKQDTKKFILKITNDLLRLDVEHNINDTTRETKSVSSASHKNDKDEENNVFSDRSISKQISSILKTIFNYFTKNLTDWKKVILIEKNSKPSEEFVFSFKIYKPHKKEEKDAHKENKTKLKKQKLVQEHCLEVQVRIFNLKMQHVLDLIFVGLQHINFKDGQPKEKFDKELFNDKNPEINEIVREVSKFNWFDEDAFKRHHIDDED